VEALFYARFGVQYLPGMYMLLGVISFVTSLGMTALLGRLRHELFYIYVPVGIAILTVIAWAMLFSGWSIVYPVLWLGKEIINSLITLVVWGLAGAVCNTRQSKRLFPLFNAGRILGSVLGGWARGCWWRVRHAQPAADLGRVPGADLLDHQVLIKAYMHSEPVIQSFRSKRQAPLIQEMQQGWRFVRISVLMRWVSLAAILFSVLFFRSRYRSPKAPRRPSRMSTRWRVFWGVQRVTTGQPSWCPFSRPTGYTHASDHDGHPGAAGALPAGVWRADALERICGHCDLPVGANGVAFRHGGFGLAGHVQRGAKPGGATK